MMAHNKQLLHELLKEEQEPFHLKTYIQDRRSHFNKSSQTVTTLQLKKRNPVIPETSAKRRNLCRHACFLSFQNSPDVRKSPFLDFPSPLRQPKSPCKSPNAAVFLHIPSRTAAVLVEAAIRIQKQQQQSKPKTQIKNVGFGLLGSFLKRLRDRGKNKKRAIEDSDIKVSETNVAELEEVEESIRMSCSCRNRRLSSADWTEENNEDKSLDFEASTSSSECSDEINHDFGLSETRFCSSPFRFSLHKSPSSSGRRTPEFCSPAASPSRHVKQEKENYEARNSSNVRGGGGEEEGEKEQCSPVSVLGPPFEDDDGHESGDANDHDYDLNCGYDNVQRTKQQLLYRLKRFEKLAELDPVELERKLLEGSYDDDDLGEPEQSDDDEPLSLYRQHNVEAFVTQVINQSSLRHNSRNITADMKRLVSDLIVEEKRGISNDRSCDNEVVVGRICDKLALWREVESNTIDMMIGLDFKTELDGWTKFREQLEETVEEIEVAIYGLLADELSDELF